MNRLITSAILCFAAIASSAQSADIEVSYTAVRPNFRDGKTSLTNQYILLANARESKFFSPVTEYIDSLNSTPEGKAKIQEISRAAFSSGKMDDIPHPDGTIYVVKSFSDGRLTHYDTSGVDKLFYEDSTGGCDWAIGDTTKVILGYECVMATADYHGRKWTAWFSPEIPVQNGPWKFDGLPGLILEAAEESGRYSFTATGIQQTTKPLGPVYLADEYEKTSRIEYLKAKRAFNDNPLGKINASFAGQGVVIKDAGLSKSLYVPASVVDFIETDYH